MASNIYLDWLWFRSLTKKYRLFSMELKSFEDQTKKKSGNLPRNPPIYQTVLLDVLKGIQSLCKLGVTPPQKAKSIIRSVVMCSADRSVEPFSLSVFAFRRLIISVSIPIKYKWKWPSVALRGKVCAQRLPKMRWVAYLADKWRWKKTVCKILKSIERSELQGVPNNLQQLQALIVNGMFEIDRLTFNKRNATAL